MSFSRVVASVALLSFLPSTAIAQIVGGAFVDDHDISSPTAGEAIGTKCAMLGDVDGDGLADFAVGARTASPNGLLNAGSVWIHSGVTGAELYRFDGTQAGEGFGISIADAGDFNGDGRGDLLVGAPLRDEGGLANRGKVFVFSGLDGSLLFSELGSEQGELFGFGVAGTRDYNLDGQLDLVVGAILAKDGVLGSPGAVFVIDGSTHAKIFTKYGTQDGSEMGVAVETIDDLNADGYPEFIGGAQFENGGFQHQGALRVWSGMTGDLIHDIAGDLDDGHLGFSIAVPGDSTGDGLPDILAGLPRAILPGKNHAGAARLYDGETGALVFEWLGTEKLGHFGATVAGAGDVDDDGLADLVVASHLIDANNLDDSGRLHVISANGGFEMCRFEGADTGDRFGVSASGPADTDGDGHDEFLIGSNGADVGGVNDSGRVIVTGYDPFLDANVESISSAAGGTIEFDLAFPASEGGQLYWTFLSASGLGPSSHLGILLPIAQDGLFQRSANGQYPPNTTGATGTLDVNGDGLATFVVDPDQLSGAIGGRFWACVATYDPIAGGRVSSGVASILVEP